MSWSGQVRVQVSIQLRIYRWTWGKGKKLWISMKPAELEQFCSKEWGEIAMSRCAKLIETCAASEIAYYIVGATFETSWPLKKYECGYEWNWDLLHPPCCYRHMTYGVSCIQGLKLTLAMCQMQVKIAVGESIAGFVNSNNAILWEHERASAALSRKFKFCQFKYSSVLGVGSFLCANVQNTCQKSRVSDNAWILN